MKRTHSIVCTTLMLAAVSGVAMAAEPLTNTLTAVRVSHDANGHEQFSAADTARPGDVLEYRVELRNGGASPVRGLEATLPIPAGMTVLPASIEPAGAQASVDGVAFAPLPLKQRVRTADGVIVEQTVPLQQYHYLRWNPADIAPHAALAVRARMTLGDSNSAAPAATAR